MRPSLTLLAAFAVFALLTVRAEAAGLSIHFIDAGEGEAIFIETGKAGLDKKILIDTGNFITGHKVAEYLKAKGVKKLDYLILTHRHPDHIGGSFTVIQTFNPGKIHDNWDGLSEPVNRSDMFRWYVELARSGPGYSPLKAGDSISLGEVELKVVWPVAIDPEAGANPNSLVIMVRFGAFRALLTGDLVKSAEPKLMTRLSDIRAQVLKVGHHAADDSSSEAFLRAVAPKAAVVSVNPGNIRGYPSNTTLERLRAAGAEIYRTDVHGDVVVTASPDGRFGVVTEKK